MVNYCGPSYELGYEDADDYGAHTGYGMRTVDCFYGNVEYPHVEGMLVSPR